MLARKQILIIQTASIGDIVLATPVLESYNAIEGVWHIDIMVRKGFEGLFEGHPFIRDVIIWDKHQRKYSNLWRLMKQVRKQRYDVVINLQRFASTGFVTAFSKAKNKIGFAKNPFSFMFSKKIEHLIGTDSFVHEVDRNLMLLNGFVKPLRNVRLYPSEKDFQSVEIFKAGKYICIAPASLWETKRLPPDKWTKLIDSLPEDLLVYLIGSKDDLEVCTLINKNCIKKKALIIAGKLTLLQTTALMKDAVMNFTNDSAPQHLASAMNANVATVFCSTVPAFGFGPLSSISHIIETSEKLSCRPCGLHGYKKCPEKHFKCAETITNEQLLSCLT